jgi:MFS family permease
MSGIVISQYWLATMNPCTLMVCTITTLYDISAFFGTIAAAPTAEGLGWKRTLLLDTAIVIIGAVLMSSAVEWAQLMVARIVTGGGIGYVTFVTPVYQSEISTAAHKGWRVCCQLTTMLFGLMLAYWIKCGVNFINSAFQWRFLLLLQYVFAVYIHSLPDTLRWLMGHNDNRRDDL